MFRSFIYLDEEKMYSYLRQIDKSYVNKPVEINRKKSKSGSLGNGIAGISIGTEIEEHHEITKDQYNDYDAFEKQLEQLEGTEYFDFALNDSYDLMTVPKMSIIRMESTFVIPEQFDMYSLAQDFMPYLSSQIPTTNKEEEDLATKLIGEASADIPILADGDDIIASGKLNTKSLREDYTALEEYSEQDVFILCKVIGLINKAQVEIFNPFKDFIKLPRAIRRGMDSENKYPEPITAEGPILRTEIIAIYK